MDLGGFSSILSVKVFALCIADFADVVICNIVTCVDILPSSESRLLKLNHTLMKL